MRCFVASCFGLALLGAVSGCRSCDRVESELRARENDVLTLRSELDRCGVYNQALQQENHTLRGQLGMPPDGPPVAAYPVQSVVLGRQTGGRNNNDVYQGDDALQVQIQPMDPEGQAIKVPGQLLIHAQEITPEGFKRPLSSWAIPPEQLRQSWRNGLLTTGYVLNLPWKVWPSTDKLRVTAQFQLMDGRVFEADRDVMVRLLPSNQRPSSVPSTTPTPTFPPAPRPVDEPPTLLPPPRIEPGKGKDKAPPPDSVPGPFLGAARPNSDLWESAEPASLPPLTEILRPIPLPAKSDAQ